jgi:NAD-dependent deacetylase
MSKRGLRICVLTGAGVSAASGLPTFREPGNGLWAKYDPYKLATPEAFRARPDEVHEFYNLRRRFLCEAQPNAAHRALASLERKLAQSGGHLTIITQNVDDLHERGGSVNVLHIHGELLKARCSSCGGMFRWTSDLSRQDKCPGCGVMGNLRPHVVWFGEEPFLIDEAIAAATQADLFVAIGTSGSVYPAAGLVGLAAEHGVRTCEINVEPSENYRQFDERLYGPAEEVVPKWVEAL